MPLSDIVSVSIVSDTVGVTAAGFGVPLILSHNASFADRVKYYTRASDMEDDGFAATDPEYLAVQSMLSASTKVEKVGIGRAALPPTQIFKISVKTVTAGETYSLRVGSDDIEVECESGTFAANDEIITDINTAIQAATGYATNGYVSAIAGSVTSKYITLTASTAGNWVAMENYNPDLLSIEQTTADPGVATDLNAIIGEDNTWYGLMTLTNSAAIIMAAAAWVEANDKMYIASSADSICVTNTLAVDVAAAASGSVATRLKTAAYARTGCIYHPATDEFADAAWLGKCLPYAPGSETWNFKTLAGVNATTLTSTHETNLQAKYCNYYTTVAGVNVTMGGGLVAANEYLDVVRFRDWLTARLQERIFARLAGNKKIPFTDAGIAIIEAEMRGQLDEGVVVGGLAADPAPTVTVPLASAVTTANKQARHLTPVYFTATLAGAIHKLTLEGTVSV
jgi:hypothetical protein